MSDTSKDDELRYQIMSATGGKYTQEQEDAMIAIIKQAVDKYVIGNDEIAIDTRGMLLEEGKKEYAKHVRNNHRNEQRQSLWGDRS